MEITETEPADEDVAVLVDEDDYRRQEFWTNGEWLRLGRDVLGDRYIEAKVENFRDFIETLRAQSGVASHTLTDSIGSDVSLIVDAGYSLDIYRDRRHVLYHREHEYSVLYTALDRAFEAQETFDYEQLVRSYVDSLTDSFWETTDLFERRGLTFIVTVNSGLSNVSFRFVDDLKADEHVTFSGEDRNIYSEDNEIHYRFKVHAATLPGAPTDEE